MTFIYVFMRLIYRDFMQPEKSGDIFSIRSGFADAEKLRKEEKGVRGKTRGLSKSFIPDPLFLSSKNGHKNHLRKFWSEKCPFFAICGKV